MNSLKLAFYLLKNNFKLYLFYLLVIVVSVILYYNLTSNRYNSQILKVSEVILYLKIASVLASIVLIASIIFFIWHSNKFFLKQREKETGLYLLMGISNSQIGKVFAIESLMLGVVALLIGLPLGILTSKFFFSLLAEILMIKVNLEFSVPIRAVIETSVFFMVILIASMFINYYQVRKSKLIDLFNAVKKEEKLSKSNWIKGALGIIIILTSYILTLNLWKWKIDILMGVPLITIAICIGTYIFFESSLSILLIYLIKCKKIVYKGTRLISFSNILFRLSTNAKSLANTAILATAMLTSLNLALSLYAYVDENFLVEVPYSVSYISTTNIIEADVFDSINKSEHKIMYQNSMPYLIIDGNNDVAIVKYSEFEKSIKLHNLKNSKALLEKAKPKQDKITAVIPAKTLGSTISDVGYKVKVGNLAYSINEEIRVPLLGNSVAIDGKYTYILSDEAYASVTNLGKEYFFHGITINNPENSGKLVMALKEISPEVEQMSSYITSYNSKYYVVGVFYYLGVIMAIVFLFATFSMIYFKILFDGLADREQYVKLFKMGMSKKEIKKSVATQVRASFILPMIIGIMHSIIAIKPVEQMLYSDFIRTTCLSVIIYIGIMIIFYFFIVSATHVASGKLRIGMQK